jgi:Uma2 family endonuclease
MSVVASAAEQRVVLDNISWSTYLAILNDAENRRGRIAYDRGVLEITSPSKLHENVKTLIARMIEAYSEATGIEADGAGSTTFKREDLERGFEPDECYYIKNADVVLAKDELDLTIDPPPDLALEVDISRTSVGKFGIYQALAVPEVWRYRGNEFEIFVLKSGDYVKAERSEQLPGFPVQVAGELLQQRTNLNQSEICAGSASGCRKMSRLESFV